MTRALTVYGRDDCGQCRQARAWLSLHNIPYHEVNIDHDTQARDMLRQRGLRTLPQIFFQGEIFVPNGWQGLSKCTPGEVQGRITAGTDLGTL